MLYWLISAFFVKKSVAKRNWRSEIIWRIIIIAFAIILIRTNQSGTIPFFVSIFYSLSIYRVIGTVLTVIGLIGAIWARIFLGRNWSGYVTYKEDQELVTTGPYRFVRHPIYSSMILMFIGTFLYYGDLFILMILTIASISIISRIKKEEEIMEKLFGNRYKDYMKRTKRLIPWIY